VSARFKLVGLKDLVEQLVDIADVGGLKAVASAGRRAFKIVEAEVKSLVPVRSGDLHDSIRIAVVKPKAGNVVASIGLKIGSRLVKDELQTVEGETIEVKRKVDAGWRWHFVEFGTSKMAAHPYLRPGFGRSHRELVEKFKDDLAKRIKAAIKRRQKSAAKEA